jgi:RNA-binding protein YlmH
MAESGVSFENSEPRELSFVIGPAEAGLRLDVFLAQADPSFSRSQIKSAIEEGDVR